MPVNLKLNRIVLVREDLDPDVLDALVGHRFSHPRHLIAFEDGFYEIVIGIRPWRHGSCR